MPTDIHAHRIVEGRSGGREDNLNYLKRKKKKKVNELLISTDHFLNTLCILD